MNLSFFIARRYFYQKKQGNFLKRIGLITFCSIALSTMALILVLSIFNGLEKFIEKLFYSFDPDIKITLKEGKYFALSQEKKEQIKAIEGVEDVVSVIEDRGLLSYKERHTIATIKGVSESFLTQNRLQNFLVKGSISACEKKANWAMLGAGIQHALAIPIGNPLYPLQVFYPRGALRKNTFNNNPSYELGYVTPSAVFSIEKHFDEQYVIVPFSFAAKLMGTGGQQTALEVQIRANYSTNSIKKAIKRCLPNEFQVLNSQEQQAALVQALHIERFFVFLTFSFILIAASLNTFFILSMLVLEKRESIAVLNVLGATPWSIRKIFLIEGLIIAVSGTLVGMFGAGLLGWLQQTFGIISLGAQTSLIEAYPIEMHATDFVCTMAGVILLTLLAAYRPARLATQTNRFPIH